MQMSPKLVAGCFFFNATAPTEFYTLSLHDALPIWYARRALAELPCDKLALYNLSCSLHVQGRKQEAQEVEKQLAQVMKDLAIVARVWDRLGKDSDRKSTRLNSSHANISYAVFCLKK